MIKKLIFFFFTIAICILIAFILFKNVFTNIQENSVKTVSTSKVVKNTINTGNELPPLYSGITWNAPNTGFVNAYFVDPQKDVIVNQIKPQVSDITTTGQQAGDFSYTIASRVSNNELSNTISYYENWFRSHGWQEDINAGGPTGDEYGFLLNGERFLINVPYASKDLSERAIVIEHN